MDTKSGSNILLPTRNTPQTQRQTLPQSKELGKGFSIKCKYLLETSGHFPASNDVKLASEEIGTLIKPDQYFLE